VGSSIQQGCTPEGTVISPGLVWYDVNGKEIHAHGGGFYIDTNASPVLYYWVVTTVKLPPDFLSEGINLYSSCDLGNWTFEGLIFKNISITGAGAPGPYRIERPKILYNQITSKYVLWFHLDTASFSLQKVGVATANKITGPYTWISGFQPDNLASYDMTVYQDPHRSDRAFLCRSVENQYAGISQLTEDYLNTTGIISKGPRIEGQAIWYWNSLQQTYLIGSNLTGWSPNPAILNLGRTQYIVRNTQWKDLGNPTNSADTYSSQSTFVLPYTHPNGEMLYIFMADDWNYPYVDYAVYVWLPILRDKDTGNISIPYYSSWRIGDFNS